MTTIPEIIAEELQEAQRRIQARITGLLMGAEGVQMALVYQEGNSPPPSLFQPQKSAPALPARPAKGKSKPYYGKVDESEKQARYEAMLAMWKYIREHPKCKMLEIKEHMGWTSSVMTDPRIKAAKDLLRKHVKTSGSANAQIYQVRNPDKPPPLYSQAELPLNGAPGKKNSKETPPRENNPNLKKGMGPDVQQEALTFIHNNPGKRNGEIGKAIYGPTADARYTFHLIQKLLEKGMIRYEQDPERAKGRLYYAT